MDKLERYRRAIETIFEEYAAIPYAHGELQCEAVFDRVRDRYLLVTTGWNQGKHVHFTLAHIDVSNHKHGYNGIERKRGSQRN